VNRALRELALEGLVTRIQGSGTVVAQLSRISSTLAFRDIHEEIGERGHVHRAKVVLLESLKANASLAQTLKLRTGAKVFHSQLIHFEGDVPIQFEDRLVNPAVAPGYLEVDFEQTTPTHYLLEKAPLTEASFSIEACLPTRLEAGSLGIAQRAPCLVMTRCTVSGGHVASLARLVYPGLRYSFNGKFGL
jgi:GntR family transcriptional regulator, histidine utilization repressor